MECHGLENLVQLGHIKVPTCQLSQPWSRCVFLVVSESPHRCCSYDGNDALRWGTAAYNADCHVDVTAQQDSATKSMRCHTSQAVHVHEADGLTTTPKSQTAPSESSDGMTPLRSVVLSELCEMQLHAQSNAAPVFKSCGKLYVSMCCASESHAKQL